MDEELRKKIDEQGTKIDQIFISVEKTRKYFKMTLWITILTVALPLLALVFVVPIFFGNYISTLNELSN